MSHPADRNLAVRLVLILGRPDFLFFPSANAAGWDAGEIAFSEMNCVACHEATPAISQRLASRKSPLLGQDGSLLSPTWVRDFLLHPQKEKPGTLMPDMLHGLSASEKQEAAEALTHYLLSLQVEKTTARTRFDPLVVKQGNDLVSQSGLCRLPCPAGIAECLLRQSARRKCGDRWKNFNSDHQFRSAGESRKEIFRCSPRHFSARSAQDPSFGSYAEPTTQRTGGAGNCDVFIAGATDQSSGI